ncbi:MAG: hypothetical protein ABWX94_01075 [Candidatus Saccharimonadales bacterium]
MTNESFPLSGPTPLPEQQSQSEVLHGYPGAMGRIAVDKANRHAEHVTQGETAPKAATPYGYKETPENMIESTLVSVDEGRKRLTILPRHTRAQLSRRLELGAMPPGVHAMMDDADGGSKHSDNFSTMERLIARGEHQGFKIPAETALNVMQWHNKNLSDKQLVFEAEVVAPLKQEVAEGVQAAVADGWMPASAIDNLSRLDRTDVYMDDGTNTQARHAHGSARSYIDDKHEVVVDPRASHRTRVHELMHVLSGIDFPANTNRNTSLLGPIIDNSQSSLERLNPSSGGIVLSALTEAVNELATVSILEGYKPDANLLDRVKKAPPVQKEGWVLLDALANKGEKHIDPRLFIAAQMENNSKRDDSAMTQLKKELAEAFPGRDIVKEIGYVEASRDPQAVSLESFVKSIGGDFKPLKPRWQKITRFLTRHQKF